MSMENAILEHATAINKLAAAINLAFGIEGVKTALSKLSEASVHEIIDPVDDKPAATPEKGKKPKDVKADPELEQAVRKVETDAKKTVPAESNPAGSAAANTSEAGAPSDDDQPELDYVKDVRPTLLAAIKKAGKEPVQAMIATFGVAKGDLVPAEKFPALLDAAKKLAA